MKLNGFLCQEIQRSIWVWSVGFAMRSISTLERMESIHNIYIRLDCWLRFSCINSHFGLLLEILAYEASTSMRACPRDWKKKHHYTIFISQGLVCFAQKYFKNSPWNMTTSFLQQLFDKCW